MTDSQRPAPPVDLGIYGRQPDEQAFDPAGIFSPGRMYEAW